MRRLIWRVAKNDAVQRQRSGPGLVAADILLYKADQVPVGDDQRQHLELARDLAIRFNSRYRAVFQIPEAVIPIISARVMDLQNPERKMSKSVSSPQGTINISDGPDEIARKIRRAVTDTETTVVYDPKTRPGVSNLLELLSGSTGKSPKELAGEYSSYGKLKDAVAESLVETLSPLQRRMDELRDDPGFVLRSLHEGAEKARTIAAETLVSAKDAVGLLAPG